MYSVKSRLSEREIYRLLRGVRCACERHAVYSIGHVWCPEDNSVFLVTRCYDCKRVRTTYIGNVFQWHLSFQDDEVIYPIESRYLYEQQQF